ncbi:MAG TPA: replicative DNA helicase [Vicinamibacteria bacterium]
MPGEVALEKALPHSLDAERTVLGAILIENESFHHASEILRQDDFYRQAHQKIFARMESLSSRGQGIDLVTLKEELARVGELEAAGGIAYLTSLVDGVPRATNVPYYSRIVKEKSVLRSLISSANRIIQSCFDEPEDTASVLDQAEKTIFEIAEGSIRTGFEPVSDIVRSTFKSIDELSERREMVTGVPTGFEKFEELTSGLQRSDLIIVAARPAMGKTSFCLNVAQHAGLTGRSIGILSLEMSKEQLVLRMLCSEARVDMHRLRSGFISEKDWSKLIQAVSKLSSARIFIDDSPSLSVLEMRAKARRLKLEHGLDLLIVDYLQLMQGRGRFENRNQEIASISRSLKGLAKELNIPVVALSQLSRAPEGRGDHRPQLSDLRESGALEQDADVVVFIYREEEYNETPENKGLADLIISKQRNGPTGVVRVAFIKEYTRFENLEWRQDAL